MALQSLLELLLRTRKEGKGAKELSGELKDLKQASGEAGKAAEKLNLGMLAVQGAVISAGIAFLKSVPAIVEHGIEIKRAETALETYIGSSEAATEAIEMMKDATDGAISRMDAMQNMTRMLSMGLASNAEEAANLTRIAVTLGSTMGKGPQQALEEFTLMLANQSILRLDTFGISGANVRDRMQELADEGIAPADRQMRFLIATMEEADSKMQALDEAGYSASSNLDRFKSTVEDLKDSVATWLADGLMPWIDGIYALIDANKAHQAWLEGERKQIILTSRTYGEYVDRTKELELVQGNLAVTEDELFTLARFGATNIATLSRSTILLTENEFKLATSARLASTGIHDLGRHVKSTTETTIELAEASRDVSLSLGEVTEATLAREAISQLNEEWKNGLYDEEQYKDLFLEIASTMGDMSPEAIDAQMTLFDLNQEFERTGDMEAYIAGLQRVAKSTEDVGEDSKTAQDKVSEFWGLLRTGPGIASALERDLEAIDYSQAGAGAIESARVGVEEALAKGLITQEEADAYFGQLYIAAQQIEVELGNITAYQASLNIRENIGGSLDDARKAVDNLKIDLAELVAKELKIKVSVYYNLPPQEEAYQYGGSFIIQGPPGPDKVPVFFRGTAGERVDITPRGQVGPGSGGGMNFWGDINISGASGDPSAMVDEFLAELGKRQQQANASGMGYIGA